MSIPTSARVDALTRPAPFPAAATGTAERVRVVIIGAGIGGLVLSHALSARGVPHVVLERSNEPGGVIRTIEKNGHLLEMGPQRTRLTPAVLSLVRLLGLEKQLLLAPADLPLYIYRSGRLRLAPLSATQLLHTDLFSAGAKLRLLAEPFTAPAHADESIAGYFTRRFGVAAYEDLLGPLFGGLYGSDPRDMLVRHALQPALHELGAEGSGVLALLKQSLRRKQLSSACSFLRGMHTLTNALHQRQREYVRLNTGAIILNRMPKGWEAVADDASFAARDIVLTCPAGEAARLLADAAPDTASRLARLEYNDLVIVHMLSSCNVHGVGYQVSFAESMRTRGVTFNHAFFARTGINTAFLGGARDPDAARYTDDRVARIAADEFEFVTGCAAEAIQVTRAAIPAWNRSWVALDRIRLPQGIHLCANYESRIGIPGRIARAHQLAARL